MAAVALAPAPRVPAAQGVPVAPQGVPVAARRVRVYRGGGTVARVLAVLAVVPVAATPMAAAQVADVAPGVHMAGATARGHPRLRGRRRLPSSRAVRWLFRRR